MVGIKLIGFPTVVIRNFTAGHIKRSLQEGV